MKTAAVLLGFGLAAAGPYVSAYGDEREPPRSELWIFAGAQGGLSDLSGTTAPEDGKSGWNLGFKGVLSKYTPDWVFDLGVGWFHDQQTVSSPNSSIKVSTNGAFADLSARYRLSPHWQIGPSVPLLFGPDVGFSDDATSQSMAVFAGARVDYDFLLKDNIVRLGAQAVTDITIDKRQVSWFQIDFQFGFPTSSHREAEPAPAPVPVETPEPVVNLPVPPIETPPKETIFPAKIIAPAEVAITLNDVFFHFDTDSAKLHAPAVKRLKKLGYYLLKNNDAWAKIRVDGHTDLRGTAAHNTKLSQRRAQSVANELVKNGVPKNKIKATGYGPTRPVDPAHNHVAYAKNRRVEVILEGVTDTKRLAKEINNLSE
jgi:outer membrane protein OmpA-like peptidoglycan-associated protein